MTLLQFMCFVFEWFFLLFPDVRKNRMIFFIFVVGFPGILLFFGTGPAEFIRSLFFSYRDGFAEEFSGHCVTFIFSGRSELENKVSLET